VKWGFLLKDCMPEVLWGWKSWPAINTSSKELVKWGN